MSEEIVARGRAPLVKYRDGAGRLHEGVLSRVVDEDLLGGVPVRDFRWFKGRRFYSGWYWSATTGGLVAYESRLELARILLADFDPEVTAIAAQPFLLTGFDGETGGSTFPAAIPVSRYGLECRARYTMTHKHPQADGSTSGASRTAVVHQDGCLI